MSLFDDASLIVTPNGVKEGKLYSIKPSDGSGDLSVTRATTATRVNSSGLVEVVPRNLIQQSSTFNVSPWVNSGVTLTSGITDVNGGTNAFRFQCPATNSFIYNLASATTGTQYTHSIYARSVSGTQSIRVEDAYSGAFVNTTLNTEWQRITLTFNATINEVGILIYNNYGAYATDIYICFAQTEQGATATDYYPTTTRLNIPRLDYTNGTCPNILVEPQRTNLVLRSQEFDNASWVKASVNATANNAISPTGLQDAELLTTSASGLCGIYQLIATGSGTFSFSAFAKKGNNNYFAINIQSNSSNNCTAVFDLSDGTLGEYQTEGSTAYVSHKIENYGNGWYRCTIVFSTTTSSTYFFPMFAPLKTGNSFTSSGEVNGNTSGKTIYLFGTQLEAGANATSYIPTVAASVTRNADVISKTGISSLIGQTEGTMFLDFNLNLPTATQSTFFSLIGNNDWLNNAFYFDKLNNNKISFASVKSATGNGGITSTNAFTNQRVKIALKYSGTSLKMFINGNLEASGSLTNQLSVIDALYLNHLGTLTYDPNFQKNNFNSVVLWKTALTDEQLATLTTI
jgi:hypothetical protein